MEAFARYRLLCSPITRRPETVERHRHPSIPHDALNAFDTSPRSALEENQSGHVCKQRLEVQARWTPESFQCWASLCYGALCRRLGTNDGQGMASWREDIERGRLCGENGCRDHSLAADDCQGVDAFREHGLSACESVSKVSGTALLLSTSASLTSPGYNAMRRLAPSLLAVSEALLSTSNQFCWATGRQVEMQDGSKKALPHDTLAHQAPDTMGDIREQDTHRLSSPSLPLLRFRPALEPSLRAESRLGRNEADAMLSASVSSAALLSVESIARRVALLPRAGKSLLSAIS